MKPHWPNPYKVVNVPIEELAECHVAIGKNCQDLGGSTYIVTTEMVLEWWRSNNEYVDAYILPQPSGRNEVGIRYGEGDSQYLSPACDDEKVAALLKKYKR